MGLSAGVAPRRGRCADEPGLESPGYQQDIAPRWEASSRKSPRGNVSRLDGIALHEDFAVTQEVVIHHAGSDTEMMTRVASAKVVMARCRREEEPLFDPHMPVAEGIAGMDAFAPGGLMRFVDDGGVVGRALSENHGRQGRRWNP